MGQDMLNRDTGIPLHYQVRMILSGRIRHGYYPLNARLPNELELSREFGVSRPTIRKALDELAEMGMVRRLRPQGTFVCPELDPAWLEEESVPAFSGAASNSLQIALEESLADLSLLQHFEEFSSSTGIRVELVQWNSWYDAVENIISRFVEKKVPDVFSVSNDTVGIFARMDMLRPLDEFIPAERLRVVKERCIRYGMGSYLHNGRLYGYPLFSETRLLAYRRDHFANAGLPDPAEHPLTHDSFLEAARQLSSPEQGLYAFAFPTNQEPLTLQAAMPWIIQRGGRMFYINNGRVLPATEEPEFIEGLRWLTDLSLKHRICPPSPSILSTREIASMMVRGQVSMMTAPPSTLEWMMKTAGGNGKYGYAPFPTGPANSYTFMGGIPLCISSSCHCPDAAWSFIAHLTDSARLIPYLRQIGGLLPIELYPSEEIARHCPAYLAPAAAALETAVPHTYPVGYNQTSDFMRVGYWQVPITQVLDLILRGELTVEHAAKYLSMSIRAFSKQNEY